MGWIWWAVILSIALVCGGTTLRVGAEDTVALRFREED